MWPQQKFWFLKLISKQVMPISIFFVFKIDNILSVAQKWSKWENFEKYIHSNKYGLINQGLILRTIKTNENSQILIKEHKNY